MENMLRKYWQGKRILITGASSGLGWALAEALAPFGVHLGLMSRREQKLQELAETLRDTGSRFWIRACDVRQREAVIRAVQDFAAEASGLDVVWANSGVGYESSMRHWEWDEIEAMLDTNLKGAIYTIKAALDVMVPQRSGTVVGICSAASMRGLPLHGIYSVTKIGLAYFMESMAVELPSIQFTTIHPGYVDTPINAGNPNRFWLLQPPEAAQKMIRAVAKKKHVYTYPWQMMLLYRLVHAVPAWIYVPVMRKMGRLALRGAGKKKKDQ
ncbi:MAG: SDR family NAD(P)-dependent oxidoreductase [candidate division KSB1 bacterium]|nr:SDR family NAD(P)-dependent oxidoreductase [candidate division KSB1 bacterium]